jgi:hypothetical protein
VTRALVVAAILAAGCMERGGHDRVLQPGRAELPARAPEVFASGSTPPGAR